MGAGEGGGGEERRGETEGDKGRGKGERLGERVRGEEKSVMDEDGWLGEGRRWGRNKWLGNQVEDMPLLDSLRPGLLQSVFSKA